MIGVVCSIAHLVHASKPDMTAPGSGQTGYVFPQ